MSQSRRLIILRHGQTNHNAKGLWQGHLDVPLSTVGEAQAQAAADALAGSGAARVVTSDLSRAAETARVVAERLGVPLEVDERLREIHAGKWQGLSTDEVKAVWPTEWAAVMAGEDIPRGVDGERLTQVHERGTAALRDLVAGMAPGECVIVSTHGASARAMTAGLLSLDLGTAWRVLGGLGNCHWAELNEGQRGWRVMTWNVATAAIVEAGETPH